MHQKFLPYNQALVERAKQLRKEMTYSERLLWSRLKRQQLMGYDFDRQKPILNYIVDFYCKEAMLAIEVDGITHHDDAVYASNRQSEIEQLGVSFLRFDAMLVVKNIDTVVNSIVQWLLQLEETRGVPTIVQRRRRKDS
jgi:very-short-patch-repair endonuclease